MKHVRVEYEIIKRITEFVPMGRYDDPEEIAYNNIETLNLDSEVVDVKILDWIVEEADPADYGKD